MTIVALARAAHVLAVVDRRRRRRDDDHLASRRQIAECRIGHYGIRGVRAALRVASLERLLLVVSTPSAAAPVPANGSAIEQSEVITTVSTALSARGIAVADPLQEFGADTGCGSASAADREQGDPTPTSSTRCVYRELHSC